jgi:hypothetical protein
MITMNLKLLPCPCTRKILVQYQGSIPNDMNMSRNEIIKKKLTSSMAPSMLKNPNQIEVEQAVTSPHTSVPPV